jgi:hypothetical protein
MGDFFARSVDDLINRVGGPLSFRFLLQPTVAIVYAIIDGIRDARAGKPAYFWSLLSDPAHVWARIMEGWGSLAKLLALVAILDLVYELIVFKTIMLGQTIAVVIVVAVLPYMLLRGPANRIARLFMHDVPPVDPPKT